MKVDNKIFVENMKTIIRERFHGNASDLCRKAGIPRTTLQNILNGNTTAVQVLARLASATGLTMDELYNVSLYKKQLDLILGKPEPPPKHEPRKYRMYD